MRTERITGIRGKGRVARRSRADSRFRIVGVGDARLSATLYRAEIEIDGEPDVIEVAAWGEGEEVIVGRDLLNRWVARFDGPRRVLELSR